MSVRVRSCGWVWGALLGCWVSVGGLAQQVRERVPAATVGAELRGLASRAGVVFVGQVAKIEPKDGVVAITFAVEQPVLGAAGGSYVLREWAGRWTGGRQDFQVGERAMFFLHAPNAAGLSSAVDGRMGAVPVLPMGANGVALLDVRWLAARVKRALGAPLAGAGSAGIALADGVAVAKGWGAEGLVEPKVVRLPEGVVGVAASPVMVQRRGQAMGFVAMKEAVDAER